MAVKIPISEQQFLSTVTAAAAVADDEKKKKTKKELYEQLLEAGGESAQDYQKIEYQAPTSSQIKDQASELANENYSALLQKYLDSYAEKTQKQQDLKSTAQEKSDTETQKIQKSHQEAVNDAQSGAIKKGIARSSIIEGIKQSIGEQTKERLKQTEETFGGTVAKIEAELNKLETQKQENLDKLNTDKENEIQSNIEKLIKESEKQANAAQKHNAEVDKKLGQLNGGEKVMLPADVFQNRLKALLDYYLEDSPQDTFEDFAKDSEFKKYFGAQYDLVYALLRARAQR